ncbi:hypothetical protein CLCR_06016 [Cladophialophora carrionii]|uniref:Heterokaryon incompatibility domain-containing protein n=1 Tax=Cladophialophora carrionii TaxID=86049 RepID=A0A1C1C9Y3_9EURO|nr:hypothetical protein CLCR_06016 [Cladophialophora carrionii]
MDSIFQSAYLVIVAAAGSDANAGLPGVRSMRHTRRQQRETINGVQFITAQPAVRHALEETEWNTRGWTFQELLLARLLLVFTENQVYWTCRTSSWREDATGELSMAVIQADETNSFWRRSSRRFECPTYSYCTDVVNFSKRVFKDERDVLWAFMGILKLHASRFPQGFIWGMPFEQLDATLLWNEDLGCGNVHKRRTYHPLAKERSTGYMPYPSWSWLSTRGDIAFMDCCGCSIVSEVSWHRPLLFSDSNTHRDTPSSDITDYGLLRFTAQTVELWLVREEKNPFEQAFISEAEDLPRIDIWVKAALYTPSGKAIGTVEVPNSFFNAGLKRSGEWLLLSSNAEQIAEKIRQDPSDNIPSLQRCVRHTPGM